MPNHLIFKPISIATLLVFVVTLGFVFLPYRPHILPGPTFTEKSDLPVLLIPSLKIHVFNTGFNQMSPLLARTPTPWRPVPAFVIEHPKFGLIVFDAGLSAEVEERGESALPVPMRWLIKSRGRPEWALNLQMQNAGLDPAKVSKVILSHSHEDHTGTVGAFENAQIVKEFAAQKTTHYFLGDAWDLLGDQSILIFKGGGHTKEDLMALVQLEKSVVLLTGDAVVHFSWLNSDDVERIPVNPERSAEVRNRIRWIIKTQPEIVVIPGHDMSQIPSNRSDILIHNPASPDWKPED